MFSADRNQHSSRVKPSEMLTRALQAEVIQRAALWLFEHQLKASGEQGRCRKWFWEAAHIYLGATWGSSPCKPGCLHKKINLRPSGWCTEHSHCAALKQSAQDASFPCPWQSSAPRTWLALASSSPMLGPQLVAHAFNLCKVWQNNNNKNPFFIFSLQCHLLCIKKALGP